MAGAAKTIKSRAATIIFFMQKMYHDSGPGERFQIEQHQINNVRVSHPALHIFQRIEGSPATGKDEFIGSRPVRFSLRLSLALTIIRFLTSVGANAAANLSYLAPSFPPCGPTVGRNGDHSSRYRRIPRRPARYAGRSHPDGSNCGVCASAPRPPYDTSGAVTGRPRHRTIPSTQRSAP